MKKSEFINDTKICTSCGRKIEYRKKWEKNWPEVKYCSDECRRNKNKFDYREKILARFKFIGPHKTICPSELIETSEFEPNKNEIEHVRRSARLLAVEGIIEILQNDKVVDPTSFKGPIRMRLKLK